MGDSSFCQQKPYPCTVEYYTFTSLFDNVGGRVLPTVVGSGNKRPVLHKNRPPLTSSDQR